MIIGEHKSIGEELPDGRERGARKRRGASEGEAWRRQDARAGAGVAAAAVRARDRTSMIC